jgi:NAD+ kinase
MLRAGDLVAAEDTPVIGINIGHLGYLTQIDPDGARMALKRFLSGAYAIESRMLLAVQVEGASEGSYIALNEAVIEKTPSGHTVRLAVSVNGEFFTTYAADGLIVATPTGSTAYSFSARGPIVAPDHRCLVLTPVSPHMLFDRSLVLDADEDVRLVVIDERRAVLTLDGRALGTLETGDAVTCAAGPEPARIVSFGGRNFHQILKTKFRLPDR